MQRNVGGLTQEGSTTEGFNLRSASCGPGQVESASDVGFVPVEEMLDGLPTPEEFGEHLSDALDD